MAKMILEIEVDHDTTQLQALLSKGVTAPKEFMSALINMLGGIQGGAYNAAVNCKIGAVAGSKAGTFTGDPTADDTVTINGVAFTAKASGATGDQYNIGANVTAHAANLAAAINASTTAGIADVIFAESSVGTITLKSKQAGKLSNAIVLSESTGNFTLVATKFTGGTQDTNKTYVFGKAASVSY